MLSYLTGRIVLEVACGTGFWTERLASECGRWLATDASSDVLDLARRKSYPLGKVTLAQADAYSLTVESWPFTAGFAAFWWSHVPRERLAAFLDNFHARLAPGARVVFCDNRFVEGNSTPLSRRDSRGNTYQLRRLADGSQHEVMKNFPTGPELQAACSEAGACNFSLLEFTYYWCAQYRVGTP
jgi:demethylmenaquinone methyltransferase/2-methoxy-6-polyprenyl-1,4-benzoquinol methylase